MSFKDFMYLHSITINYLLILTFINMSANEKDFFDTLLKYQREENRFQ